MSRSLAAMKRRVREIERYQDRYDNMAGSWECWLRRRNARARALAHRFRRRHGRWPWEGPNFGIAQKGVQR